MNAEWPQAAQPERSPKPESGEQERSSGHLPDNEFVSEPSQASEAQPTKVFEPNPMKRLREPEEARGQLSERVLDVINQDITWVKRRLQSPNKPSLNELLKLQNQLNQRREKLEGILANRFQKQGDAPERRAIQDAILEINEAHELLRGWLTEEKSVEVERQPYLSAGERDQFTRLRAWAKTPEATEEKRGQKEDHLRHRLGEVERDMPRDPNEAEQRQKDIQLLKELIQYLESPQSSVEETLAQKIGEIDSALKATAKEVKARYGKAPDALTEEDLKEADFMKGIFQGTSNAFAALMGTQKSTRPNEPYARWKELLKEKQQLEARQRDLAEKAQQKNAA